MSLSPFNRERLACAYFFAVPGLLYGIFTARLPALKQMAGADDSLIGFLLLAYGGASFIGLVSSSRLVGIFGIKRVIGVSSLMAAFCLAVAGLAFNYAQLMGFCVLSGLFGGLLEVAMNAQGMQIEQRFGRLCMASLHACFSLGGMAGSLFGSLFAGLDLSPFLNFAVVSGAYLMWWAVPYRCLVSGKSEKASKARPASRIPRFIIFCGLLSMLCYVSEGSVGEWGSILLHSVKGAPQDQAALVFGCFCASMVVFRLLGDKLRQTFGDLPILIFGGLMGAACMSLVLLSSSAWICLAGYTLMGIGFAPLVPILFSRAGKYPGIAPARASSAVSIMSYTGLLVFPPVLGMLGDWIGLGNALWIIVAASLCVALGGMRLLGSAASQG